MTTTPRDEYTDSTLLGLALLDTHRLHDASTLSALLDVTEQHEAITALLKAGRLLSNMVAERFGLSEEDALDRVRTQVMHEARRTASSQDIDAAASGHSDIAQIVFECEDLLDTPDTIGEDQ